MNGPEMIRYIAIVAHSPTGFSLHFPDLPGCCPDIGAHENVRAVATEMLKFHLDGMVDYNDTIPQPRDIADLMADWPKDVPALEESTAILWVSYEKSMLATLPVAVTLQRPVIDEIDMWFGDRARFLAEAAREKLAAFKSAYQTTV